MNTAALRDALAARGLGLDVAADGRLAVLRAKSRVNLDTPTRRWIVTVARQHGFANVCLEIGATD